MENIKLRIKDMTTLHDCIEEAKVRLTICQPSSLISRMTTLTVALSEMVSPACPHLPFPMRRNQGNNTSTDRSNRQDRQDRSDRQGRQRQRMPILKKIHISRIQTVPR